MAWPSGDHALRDNIEDKLDNPGEPKVLYDEAATSAMTGSWKFLVHKDEKLYCPIARLTNIYDPAVAKSTA